MAERVPARLTADAGRRFGLTVGGAFLVIAAITGWRGHVMATYVLGALGAVLTLAGLVIPTHLRPVERAWMALAHAISKVTTPIVMGIMYLLVITPVGYVRRGLGSHPLVHVPVNKSYWQPRAEGARRSKSMQRQF